MLGVNCAINVDNGQTFVAELRSSIEKRVILEANLQEPILAREPKPQFLVNMHSDAVKGFITSM